MTVGELIRRTDAHRALVATDGRALTYGQLHESIGRLAGELRSAGVQPGDAVALSLANGPDVVISFLAVLALRAGAAPLNPAYTAEEARGYLTDLEPRLLVCQPGAGPGIEQACGDLGIPVKALAADRASTPTLGLEPSAEPDTAPDQDDVALLLHTSGTTSRPKVVPLRQRNLAASITSIVDSYGLDASDVSHCVMPLFHVHGLVASTLATLASGGTVVLPPRFSASAFWADTVSNGATWYSAVPTIHQVLTLRAEQEPIPPHGLRFARSCSAALSPVLQSRLEALLDVPVLQAYGMTEAAHQMATNPPPPAERRPGSVGRATGIEIAALDEDWNPVAAGTAGEVAVRGPSIVDGYRDNPEANLASFRDGWFRTGDLGSLSADGYLTLEGRIKELINRGGEKISPLEVETVLLAHPEVREAVVYGLPDDKYGEVVAAVIVARAPVAIDELIRHCAERLAAFKVPVSVAVMDRIPTGPTGKVQRRLIAGLVAQ